MKKILNLFSLFFAVIGLCTVTLICHIIFIYPNLKTAPNSNNIAQEVPPVELSQSTSLPQLYNTEVEPPATETESDVKAIKSGTYTIDDIEFWFSNSVINDVTGRWRISSIASSKDIIEYAIDYYNTLFSSDDEIHAVVNFSLNTTTSISVLSDGILDVTVHEYISGEEHDAKVLFNGMVLAEYFININNNEIEKIQ